ncbi:hypothetical protein B4092_4906 [Bacillus licheniformis]|nr:hypothetical protein B4092_4906 [Bacillus licheniformis]
MAKKNSRRTVRGSGRTACGKRKAPAAARNQGAQAAGMSQSGGRGQEKTVSDWPGIRKNSGRQT